MGKASLQIELQAGPEPQAGPQAGPEPQAGPQAGPEPQAGPQAGPEPQAGPQAGPQQAGPYRPVAAPRTAYLRRRFI